MPKKLILKKLSDYDTKPVTSSKITNKKIFHEDGLYSEKIFGPIKDYVCMCGNYQPYGGSCENCGMAYEKSEVRSKKFGHIPLPTEVINPLFVWFLSSRSKKVTKINLNELLYYKSYLIFEDDEPVTYSTEEFDELEIKTIYYLGAEAILKLLEWFDKKFEENDKYNEYIKLKESNDPEFVEDEKWESYELFKPENYIKPSEFKLLMMYRDNLVLDRVLVVPPDLRPILFTTNKMMIQEDLTRLYSQLLNKIEHMTSKTKFIKDVSHFTLKNYAELQYMCVNIYEEILKVFGGKKGIIRGNILGKRIDASGRAVISVDPSLKWNECRIPYHILLEVYKYVIARKIAKKESRLIFDILNEIEESLKMKDYRYIDHVEEFTKDKYVVLNRQPTLHKYGLLGFKCRVSSDNTIKIHPCICTVYNADFDGDSCISDVTIRINSEKDKKVSMEDILDLEY